MKSFTQDFFFLKDELQFLDRECHLYQNYQQQQFQASAQYHNSEVQKEEQQIVLLHYDLLLYKVQEESSYASSQYNQQNQQLLLIKEVNLKIFKYQQKDECWKVLTEAFFVQYSCEFVKDLSFFI